MAYTKVNFVEMQRVQGELLKVITALDTETDNLIKDLKGILGNKAWEGGAMSDFEGYKAKWDQSEIRMGEELTKAAKALGTATDNYMAAEAANRKAWLT